MKNLRKDPMNYLSTIPIRAKLLPIDMWVEGVVFTPSFNKAIFKIDDFEKFSRLKY